ncbi:glycosyltransferase [Gammaproteobacteria bacterium]|nr:glycosyltransferase [Gammaproteobacteria bacterium]
MAKVSILMNCYNSALFLKESIDSVMCQSYEDWEIIFWDNQSTDNSAEIIKQYKDKRIKYFYAPMHTSLYIGRSQGLKHCEGKYLAFLDCDDLWLPDKLEKQVDIFEKNKKVVLVHSNTVFFNSDTKKEKILNSKKRMSGYIFEENILNYQFSLETVMVRLTTVFENSIDFSDYNMIGDRDFLSMVCFYGDVYYIDEILGKWRIHANNYSKVLHIGYPKELKKMYLRFKKQFKDRFTKNMRVKIYTEIVLRDALNSFIVSGTETRKKLNKIYWLAPKSIFLRLLSYLPTSLALKIINLAKKSS